MKYMRLGTQPDTFFTEEATRTVSSDFPSDLVVRINNITYLLHKHLLLPKCGLLQRLYSDSVDSSNVTVELHDIPGGKNAFELCAKFCYGITIDLSAQNFVPAFCAAKFLRMTEAVEKGNLIAKLEAFFNSCILQGWKDSLVTLQSTATLPEWSENLGIIRRCIDSIVEKILIAPSKVKWSYTYSRQGYTQKQHQAAPKDWWTEDISNLNIDIFRCIISAIKSHNLLSSQLIGEALHVYACRWLPDPKGRWPSQSSASQHEEEADKNRRILEMIVSLIPSDEGSVSVGFLMRLFSAANLLGVSPVTKAELVRRCTLQLENATVEDLLLPAHLSPEKYIYDIDLINLVLESFVERLRHQSHTEDNQPGRSIWKVGKLIDSYLQVVAKDINIPVTKFAFLAEALPDSARPKHDDLYSAIDIYLKEHPNITKAEKKQLCRILDCQKLSPEVRAHVVKNERLPLRTVVQVLFFDQERGTSATGSELAPWELISRGKEQTPSSRDGRSKLRHAQDKKAIEGQGLRRMLHCTEEKSSLRPDKSFNNQVKVTERRKGKEIEEHAAAGSKPALLPRG